MIDLVKEPGLKVLTSHVVEFDSMCDLFNAIEGKFETALYIDDKDSYKEYTKKNGYRIMAVKISVDDPYFTIDGGEFKPIITHVCPRIRNVKAVATPIIPIPDDSSDAYWYYYKTNDISYNSDQVFTGDGFITIAVGEYRSRLTYPADYFYMVVVMDLMYDVRKDAFQKLISITSR